MIPSPRQYLMCTNRTMEELIVCTSATFISTKYPIPMNMIIGSCMLEVWQTRWLTEFLSSARKMRAGAGLNRNVELELEWVSNSLTLQSVNHFVVSLSVALQKIMIIWGLNHIQLSHIYLWEGLRKPVPSAWGSQDTVTRNPSYIY